ncbi:MAG: hypothetical protein LUI12_01945 [Clostridiales bacterium]|nr:hypothetical protein [Clostridiales bacterium]
MATKCIDNKTDFELININTSDAAINDIANKYINDRHLNAIQSTGFNSLLLYISQNYVSKHIDVTNTDDLIYYFNIYVELCAICNIIPDMSSYSIFIDVSYHTLTDWINGEYRSSTHTEIVKKMREFCKMTCVTEASRGNVGAIYVSKAIHGLSDNAPAAQYTQNNLYVNAPVTREAIAAEFGGMLEDKNTI